MPATNPQTITPAEAVRSTRCELCRRRTGKPCTPRGDHLARWLGAYAANVISRGELLEVIVCLTIVTQRCVVPETERAA